MPSRTAKRRQPVGPLPGDLIADELDELEAEVEERAKWLSPDSESTRTSRLMLERFRLIVRKAAEQWAATRLAAKLTGWDDQTLQRWARARLEGTELPQEWRGLECRRTPAGYEFRVSTVPPRPR